MATDRLKAVSCATAANAQIFLPYLNNVFGKYNIDTPGRQLCFLAQASHESGGLSIPKSWQAGRRMKAAKTSEI